MNGNWTVFITEKMRQSAKEIAKTRSSDKEGVLASSRPLSDKYQELGVIGEIGLAEKLHLPIDTQKRMSGDAGKDLHFRGHDIDVKTARRAVYLIVEQGKVRSEIYLLCQFYADKLEYLGFAFKDEVMNAPVKDFGYGIISHWLTANSLHPMDELLKLPQGEEKYEVKTLVDFS